MDFGRCRPFGFLWNPERETFVLFRREIGGVVRVQIKTEPYQDDHGKRDKARTVVYCCEKGNQKDPKGKIISLSNEGEWAGGRLFGRNVVSSVLLEPCEPHGCMAFDDQSIKHPGDRKPDQSAHCRPDRSGKSNDDIS